MRTLKLFALSLFLLPFSIDAQGLPCFPCAGVRFETAQSVPVSMAEPLPGAPVPDVQPAPAAPTVPMNPADFVSLLRQAKLEKGSPLFVAWEVPLGGADAESAATAQAVTEAGGTPWLSLIFTTPAPLAQNAERLQGELRIAAAIASAAPASTWLQVVWRPEGQTERPAVASRPSGSGYFWFFGAANIEEIVKVLDGCPVNNRKWVFLSGLTNVRVVTTVTDTQTGDIRTYENPQGKPFVFVPDTNAFATCP